jgi:hypothetical protein
MLFRQSLVALSGAFMIALGGATLAPAQAASPPPTVMAQATHVVGVVETVDRTTRQILLSGPHGGLVTVVAGPAVRNFSQIHSGDRLYLTFRKALGVAVAPASQPLMEPAGVAGARRADAGAMPAGGAFIAMSAVVQIDSIDRRAHTVTFTNAAGEQRTIAVRDPVFQHFAQKLKAGDKVRLDYLQSVTIKLKPDSAS